MAFRSFDQQADDIQISRRSLFRGAAMLGAGAAAASLPFGRSAFAHAGHWPNVLATVEDYVSSGKVANMVSTLGWGQKPFDLINRGTLAFGDETLADADSLYRIYSMTKPITGMATMMLIEDGAFELDTPLSEILPAFANMQVLRKDDGPLDEVDPAKTAITIRHLLTHTAGIGYDITSKGLLQKAFQDKGITSGQISRYPIPGLPAVTSAPGLEEWTNRLATLPLIAEPGTIWSYSASIDLLGRVIEVASGMTYDRFLTERLFKPAGMNSTYFRVPESEIGRYTTNYGILNGNSLPIDPAASSIYLDQPPVLWGGSALVCSPNDYDKFLRMLVGLGEINGNRLMKEETVRIGTGNILPETADLSASWIKGQQFGAGGRVTGTAFGWGGAAGTTAFADIKSGLRAANFTQYVPSQTYAIQREFPEIVLKDLAALAGA